MRFRSKCRNCLTEEAQTLSSIRRQELLQLKIDSSLGMAPVIDAQIRQCEEKLERALKTIANTSESLEGWM
ncbi:hypothetical protein LTR28_001902, partial [Elasticomyces elasticus]